MLLRPLSTVSQIIALIILVRMSCLSVTGVLSFVATRFLIHRHASVNSVDEFNAADDVPLYSSPVEYPRPKTRHRRISDRCHASSAVFARPEANTAQDTGLVVDDRNVWRQIELDVPGVTAADVQMIEPRERAQRFKRECETTVPRTLANSFQRRIAKLVLIGVIVMKWMMGQLDVRAQASVLEDRGPKSGPQCDHHLDAFPANRAEPLHVGVVAHSDRSAKLPFERSSKIESREAIVAEVRSCANYAAAHDTGKPYRDPIITWQLRGQLRDDGHETTRRDIGWRIGANTLV
jgi:hypothetical protein